MKFTRVYLIRHGETEWNFSGRKQGHLDSPLTPRGIAQAEALAARLSVESFSKLYSSDLGRASSTARIVGRDTGRDVSLDPRLRERNFGIFQGLTEAEIEADYPEDYRRFSGENADYRIPRGESAREFLIRATSCLDELAAQHRGESIVVITHGLVLEALYKLALHNSSDASGQVEVWNAAFNSFDYRNRVWKINTWSDCDHLPTRLF